MKGFRFYRYLLPFWKKEILILSLTGASTLLGLANPYLTKLIIDKAYAQKNLRLFIILVLLGIIIFILSGIFSALSNYLNRYIRIRLNFDLSRLVFKKLQNIPLAFFQNTSSGQHLYKINYDVENASRFIADVLPQAISLIPRLLFILAIIFYLDLKIALFALALSPFVWLAPYYFNQRLKKFFRLWAENNQRIFSRLNEIFSRIHLIKAFGRQQKDARSYIKEVIKNIRFNLSSVRLESIAGYANSLVSRLALGAIIFYGGWQVIKGRMTLGSLSAISIYLNQLYGMQSSFAQFFQQASYGTVSCERLETIFCAPSILPNPAAKEIILEKGLIEFRNVSFGYTKDKDVLRNLSFSIPAGACTGLTGPSGCGKTTAINLLLRLYQPTSGEIFIDGVNINDITQESLCAQIAVALQEPYLWNDTVENNIRYGKEDAAMEEIRAAARIACADGFIESLPKKYSTIIGENACKISEGQKQRIALARAIIKKPKILILDEALSSVDSETEARIMYNIRAVFKNTTIIVISHRPSTIETADLAYALKGPDKIEASNGVLNLSLCL